MIKITPSQAIALARWLSENQVSDEMLAIREAISDQLNSPRRLQDLMDTVISIIMAPQKGLLPDSVLASLQKAILNPSELARTKALANNWQTCAVCFRYIDDREIATLNDNKIYCWYCLPPSYISCKNCDENISLPGTTINKAIKKSLAECNCKKPVAERIAVDLETGESARPIGQSVGRARPTSSISQRQLNEDMEMLRRSLIINQPSIPPQPATSWVADNYFSGGVQTTSVPSNQASDVSGASFEVIPPPLDEL
jgi:hypothetical protein